MSIQDTTALPTDEIGVQSQTFDLPTAFLALLGATELIREAFELLLVASLPDEPVTAVNPETGERVGLVNGQWVPMQ